LFRRAASVQLPASVCAMFGVGQRLEGIKVGHARHHARFDECHARPGAPPSGPRDVHSRADRYAASQPDRPSHDADGIECVHRLVALGPTLSVRFPAYTGQEQIVAGQL
jgi:hypothetical protein